MTYRTIFFVLALLLFLPFTFFSQNSPERSFKSGEILIQLNSKTAINRILSSHKAYHIISRQTVSERFNIFLLSFDESRANNQMIIDILKNEKDVVHVQNNHFVSLRSAEETLPNDSLFGEQWGLNNTGQNGGVPGADIHVTSAWDINKGGVTVNGDTMVLAIVDGGGDLYHEDLNHWINEYEIPNNGVDDDNNGYIDDRNGWNAYDHNGDIPFHNHGTGVAGIAGAIGNNNKGISGVNWYAKILPVAASSQTESIVVEGLAYIYVLRETYDATNGEKGAFIVADNCSFGVDKGQPENFPIWGAMYDSLGQLGIMSVVAPPNKNWDIDVEGDVPAAFDSPYLISVTNTNREDERNTAAAYGDLTIDLGAPGTQILSTKINDKYYTGSGTSYATPHVTGAVALLMSVGDDDFMENYNSQPSETIKLVRNYILNGVDTLPTLMGKTVTGGRLNVYKSIELLLNAPQIGVDKDSVVAVFPTDSETDESLVIVNVGGDTLFYEITFEDQPDWLVLDQYEGAIKSSDFDEIILTFNSIGLEEGVYETEMVIEAEEAISKTIPVKMYVYKDTGVDDVAEFAQVKVYPNPFSKTVNFEVNRLYAPSYNLEIFDQMGRLVFVEQIETTKSANKIDWESKQKGIYFYRVSTLGQLIQTGKLISY